MSITKGVLASIGILVLIYALGFLATGGDLIIYKFWAPKQAAAERQVFVQTPSFVLGKSNRISDLRTEYKKTKDADEKEALREQILHEASEIDNTLLPVDEQEFLNQLRSE